MNVCVPVVARLRRVRGDMGVALSPIRVNENALALGSSDGWADWGGVNAKVGRGCVRKSGCAVTGDIAE